MIKSSFYKWKLSIFILLITIFSSPNVFAQNNLKFFEPYAMLLDEYVSYSTIDGIETSVVDYNLWKFDLDYPKAMKLLESANPDQLANNEKKAFWINAYNLLVIDLIIKNNETGSIRKVGGLFKNPWKSYKWKIGGKEYSLYMIENEILGKMGDPRIYMVLSCATVSCPDLMRKPYSPTDLDSQLKWQTVLFLVNENKGLQFLPNNTVKISEVFKKVEENFNGELKLREFLMEHNRKVDEKTEVIGYIKYNWKLNKF